MHEDDEPELRGYEPGDGRPLRSPHLVRVMRVVVVLGLIGLVLPTILITAGTANSTAQQTCSVYAQAYVDNATGSYARFELFGPEGMGWNCYASSFGEEDRLIAALGPIPGQPVRIEPRQDT